MSLEQLQALTPHSCKWAASLDANLPPLPSSTASSHVLDDCDSSQEALTTDRAIEYAQEDQAEGRISSHARSQRSAELPDWDHPPFPAPFEEPWNDDQEQQGGITLSDLYDYQRAVGLLSTRFSTFDNVASLETRHDWSSRLVYFDSLNFHGITETYRKELWRDNTTAPPPEDFERELKWSVPEGCHQRLILVEDMCPALVNLLGVTFRIPPYVFERHLHRSGYATEQNGLHEIKPTWHSRPSAEGYCSITWYRPVVPVVPLTTRLRKELVEADRDPTTKAKLGSKQGGDSKGPEIDCPFKEGLPKHKVRLSTCSNIWRGWLALCPTPGVCSRNSAIEYPVGWEERATTWTYSFNGCKIIIVLLDPLPQLKYDPQDLDRLSRADEHFTKRKRKEAQEMISRAMRAYGNGAQEYWTDDIANHQFIDLVPDDPSSSGPQSSTASAATHSDRTRTSEAEEGIAYRARSGDTFGQGPAKRLLKPVLRSSPKEHNQHLQFHKEPTFRLVYETVQSRFSKTESDLSMFTDSAVFNYFRSLKHPLSTFNYFDNILWQSKGKDVGYDPLWGLFNTIYENSQSLMDIIEVSVQQIREDTLNEDMVQERVSFWKGLLHHLNHSLRQLKQDVPNFSRFWTESRSRSRNLADDVDDRLSSCLRLIGDITKLLHEEMQVVHNQRNIAETESVSKLTELAFVFIPLSFAASIFSMQVNELQGDVPLSSFAGVAMGFVLSAYAVRLAIRNSTLKDIRDNLFFHIREDYHLQSSQPIPARTFLVAVGSRIGNTIMQGHKLSWSSVTIYMVGFLLMAAFASPIIVLWTRNIDKGFSSVITILLVLLSTSFVFIGQIGAAVSSEGQGRRAYRRTKKKRKMPKEGPDPEIG